MPIAIEALDMTKRFDRVEALKKLSFSIPEGEIVAFLGPNSAGKSTTMRILSGIIPATSGEATVAGYSVACQARQVKRKVGYMPEHNPLPEEATISEFLTYRARLKELRGAVVRDRVVAAAMACELSGRLMDRPIGVLSRGVRQRVGIAETLLTEPPVLILDEPTIGLDPHQVIALRDLIGSMRGKHTILLSTHILTEAEAMADRVLIINKGEKVAFGTPHELRAAYQASEQYRVVVKMERAGLERLITPLGCQVVGAEATEGGVAYHLSGPVGEGRSEALLKTLTLAPGAHLKEFACKVPSLEAIFLEATAKRGQKGDE